MNQAERAKKAMESHGSRGTPLAALELLRRQMPFDRVGTGTTISL